MSGGMDDLSFSLEMRDIVNSLVKEAIDQQRPKYRYATVVSIDDANSKCTITYNGETSQVIVNMGTIRPTAAGQIVRVEGIGTDKFITDVVGGTPAPAPNPGIATSGFVNPFAGSAAPTGWLLCDGSAVSRTTYANLFTVVGTTYGAGDGSTTFNLPNLKGRFPVGLDASQTEFSTLGKTGGAKSHNHTLSDAGQAGIAMVARATNQVIERRVGTASSYTSTHTLNYSALGGGASGLSETETSGAALMGSTDTTSTLPPYEALNYIIKT